MYVIMCYHLQLHVYLNILELYENFTLFYATTGTKLFLFFLC